MATSKEGKVVTLSTEKLNIECMKNTCHEATLESIYLEPVKESIYDELNYHEPDACYARVNTPGVAVRLNLLLS